MIYSSHFWVCRLLFYIHLECIGNYFERVGPDFFEHSWVGLGQRFGGSGQVQKSYPWTTLGEAREKQMVRSIGTGIWGCRVREWGPNVVMRLMAKKKRGGIWRIDWLGWLRCFMQVHWLRCLILNISKKRIIQKWFQIQRVSKLQYYWNGASQVFVCIFEEIIWNE